MFDGLLQPTHLILILVIVLIFFGPGKLPDVAKTLGKAVNDFKGASKGAQKEEDTQVVKLVPKISNNENVATILNTESHVSTSDTLDASIVENKIEN